MEDSVFYIFLFMVLCNIFCLVEVNIHNKKSREKKRKLHYADDITRGVIDSRTLDTKFSTFRSLTIVEPEDSHLSTFGAMYSDDNDERNLRF